MRGQIWSKYPQEAYTVTLPTGRVAGLGVHPAFNFAPGAWNLFWLTYSALDGLAYYKGDPMKYFYTCGELPICVGAALQIVPKVRKNKVDVTYGQIAIECTPTEFIEFAEMDKNFLLPSYYGNRWFSTARHNALKYRAGGDNIIHHDFRGRR